MSNVVYLNGIFNQEVKNRFLNTYDNKKTAESISRIFKRSAIHEAQLEKDLYDFNRDEIKKVLFSLSPSKLKPSRTNGAIVSGYISWAIKEGYRSNNINPLEGLETEWYQQFVDSEKVTFYTPERLNEILSKLINAQDRATFQMIYEGVGGESFEELYSLTKHDVDYNTNTLTLTDKSGNTRSLQVSERCIDYIRDAINQTEYFKNNGDYQGSRGIGSSPLEDSGYVIKKVIRKNASSEKADYFLLNRRSTTIKEIFEEPNFTPLAIRDSGMLAAANDVFRKTGDLTNGDLREICERFGISKTYFNGSYQINIFQYKRAFLNIDKIKEVYGE